MSSHRRRAIPLVAATASLTFGACGGDDEGSGPPSDSMLVSLVEDFSEALCKAYMRCYPDFPYTQKACVDYITADYLEDVPEDLDASGDADACRTAWGDALECYIRAYANVACDDFEQYDFEPCDAEWDEVELLCNVD